ncbi:unnamed protein product, partial [Mesorhabditis spiculigera]
MFQPRRTFHHEELKALFHHARIIVGKTNGVARVSGPTWIIGDIHGDFNTLARIFAAYSEKASPGQNIVFLGNIVDRGKRQLMSVVLIVAGLVLYPDRIFYVSGNHELPHVHYAYDFCLELIDEEYTESCCQQIRAMFASLPILALIDNRILAMHGGIGPELTRETVDAGFQPSDDMHDDLRIAVLWSDPNHQAKKYAWNRVRETGYFYGEEAIEEIRRELGIKFIVRAHQMMNTGVQFFGDWLISIFTSTWRKPENNPLSADEQTLLRANTREGMHFRNKIIRDEEPNPEIGGILAYDGNNRLSMIHFIPTKYTYNTHADFAKAFERKAATDLAFSENICNRPEWRTAPSSRSHNDATASRTPDAPDDVKDSLSTAPPPTK